MKVENSRNNKAVYILLSQDELTVESIATVAVEVVNALRNDQTAVFMPESKWVSNPEFCRAEVMKALTKTPQITGAIAVKCKSSYKAVKIELHKMASEGLITRRRIPGKIGRGFEYSLLTGAPR